MNLLCLDAGNTRLKWGLTEGTRWLAHGALDYADRARLPEILPAAPTRLIACNVAGEAVAAHIEALAETFGVCLDWFASSAHAFGVRNAYEEPTRLGADRWAALVAAHALAGGDKLVVLAGTATTIDLLAAEGQHLGGVILPGLALMRRALAEGTAQLDVEAGAYRLWPANTGDAITSGALEATIGAIERLSRRLPSADSAQVILSGGNAATLASVLASPRQVIDTLVLEGLRRAATLTSLA